MKNSFLKEHSLHVHNKNVSSKRILSHLWSPEDTIHIFTLIATVFPLKSAFCDEKNGIRNDFLHKNNKIFASHKYAIKVWKTLAFSEVFNLFNHIKSALNPSDITWAATQSTTETMILVSAKCWNPNWP